MQFIPQIAKLVLHVIMNSWSGTVQTFGLEAIWRRGKDSFLRYIFVVGIINIICLNIIDFMTIQRKISEKTCNL